MVFVKGVFTESEKFDDVRAGWRYAKEKERALDTAVVMVPIPEEPACE